MNTTHKHFRWLAALLPLMALAVSCSAPEQPQPGAHGEGGLLRMGAMFGAPTRLAELPSADSMSLDARGLKDIGLYVYYTSDYNNGILDRPYIRNQRCTVVNGEVLVVPDESNPNDTRIFIYDEMTLVAFYPYNPDAEDFRSRADEDKYITTRRDYSEQHYIPYRAQTETNPTISYYTQLNFAPQHVYKVEIVVVAEDVSLFPDAAGLEVLPGKDPVGNPDQADGMREKWYDSELVLTNDGSGSDVRRYTAYIWTNDGTDGNPIRRGDVLMQSADGRFTLIASQDVQVQQQNIYRYGYNLSTGEMFIPTSSSLIHDVSSLRRVDNTGGTYYQVCDIDMSQAGNWTPLSLLGGRYDGGGHALRDMSIESSLGAVGLFGSVKGNATLCNINLTDPVIAVTDAPDSAAVGALAGKLNTPLTDADRQMLVGNFPPGLSEIVKRALIEQMLTGASNNQSSIVASRVVNPAITVTGTNEPRVGTVAGEAGSRDDKGTYRASVRDTYSHDGSVTVNEAAPEYNAGSYVGGLIGLNNGYVARSYTTTSQIKADTTGMNGTASAAVGFANMGTLFSQAEGGDIVSSFAANEDPNPGVSRLGDAWPATDWINYTGIWPVNTTGWLGAPARSFWYSTGNPPDTYPTLQWERR